ncbi:MAG: acetyl-CoA hydrolase/transferase C-terminal domain-containing protein [Clostridia bacterium]|nr:acetyl-CoA hydrolase/transferase C-terminal domain-containing protein [Clostridia bacterium]MDD3832110.1 acetyl-CoA hydrolase/transferase C-terminal domain-containing protein [Clostridia bacterium]
MNYQNRLITTQQVLQLIQDNYTIAIGEGQGAPRGFLGQLHTLNDRPLTGVDVWFCRMPRSFEFLQRESNNFTLNTVFTTKPLREAKCFVNGYAPTHLSKAGATIRSRRGVDMYVVTVTPPDERGMVSTGMAGIINKEMVDNSRMIIGEINENMPYIYGATEIPVDKITYFTHENIPLDPLPPVKAGEKEMAIAKEVAKYINDGDCLQAGIGGIPDALMTCLADKKDLGVHTELLSDGLIQLIKSGAVNCSKKNFNTGKIVAATFDGSQEAFDFFDHNKDIVAYDSSYTNNLYIMGQNDNQVSVNTAIEIDITGQCCAESIGSRQFSGTGGFADTALGAQKSKGGKSFIALCSTANATINGKKTLVSKIVPQLKAGATVSLHRDDVQYIATEYGVVCLRGLPIRDRVQLMISIAHPDFREYLHKSAQELGLE